MKGSLLVLLAVFLSANSVSAAHSKLSPKNQALLTREMDLAGDKIPSDVLEALANVLLNPAFGELLGQFCDRYLPARSPDIQHCQEASRKMFQIIDCKYVLSDDKSDNDAICFYTRLNLLLRKPETSAYLEAAQTFLRKALSSREPTNFWTWTVEYYGGNHHAALEIFSALFQDTSDFYHRLIEQLTTDWDQPSKRPIQLLDSVLGILNGKDIHLPLEIEAGKLPANLNLYPEGIQSEDNRLYHFYVPAYLASKLGGKQTNTGAWFAPFLFNTYYGYARYNIERDGYVTWWFQEPKKMDSANAVDLTIMRSIHQGYAGARWGIGASIDQIAKPDAFIPGFGANPNGYIRQLLKAR